MNTIDKIDKYINIEEEIDDDIMEKMFDFLSNLDLDQIPENLANDYVDIVNELAGDENETEENDENAFDEEFARKKVKIKTSDKRKRKMEYRKNKAKIKQKARKFRKTTKFKQWKRKSARKAKQGKTATGKRKRVFI